MKLISVLLLVALLPAVVLAVGNRYTQYKPVIVHVSNVGPFNNPAETYDYYTLPFCEPEQHTKSTELGEILSGDQKTVTKYEIRFRVDAPWRELCSRALTPDQTRRLREAILKNYMFQFYIDDLPVRGFLGEVEELSQHFSDHDHVDKKVFLFTHLDFSFAYNDDRVIAVNVTADPTRKVELKYENQEGFVFSYSCHWQESDVSYVNRMALHSKSFMSDQAVEIHWLSIINSFVLVLLLTSFLAVILLRILKKDIAAYMDEEENSEEEETGWKLIHGDVFRPPANRMLLASALGNGAQMLALVVCILFLAVVGTFYPGNRGGLYTAALLLYAMTAFIAGYVSTSLYTQLGGDKWALNAVFTASLLAIPIFVVFCINNSFAVYYGSTTALPFGTILGIFLLWSVVTFPLNIFGSLQAKKSAGKYEAPCKTNRVPREVPSFPWYRSTVFQTIFAGFLPFSAIYIELHYIFASVFGQHVYTLFGILCLAFVLLLIVTAFITVALAYFQLAIEDYHWWWRSFLSGGSTGLIIYLYAAYFFLYRSEMSGALQASFFFGYMLLVSFAFFLLLGTVGFFSVHIFVKKIYSSIKID